MDRELGSGVKDSFKASWLCCILAAILFVLPASLALSASIIDNLLPGLKADFPSQLVLLEEFVSLENELSAADRLVTFPSTFIFEKLISVLTSAGAGSEKVNATVGEDAAEGTEGEEEGSEEASGTAASFS